jgi:pimeloyl-ACP methyl ester carboxylesterase
MVRTCRRLVLLLAALCAMTPAAAAPPGLALEACRLEHPAGLGSVPAQCTHLAVPEDPADPRGRQISLAIAVVRALDRAHLGEPVFIVAGGPGQAATGFYAANARAFARVLRRHDLILVDQRGTGGSNRLGCEVPDDLELAPPSPARLREVSAACRAALPGRPQFYTTSVAVRDLEAVRVALGAPRVSFYGVSYGTRVVEHYVRRHPGLVRAVVLDGALPPDASPEPGMPTHAARALELLFARCRADAACHHAFPDPAQTFATLQHEFATHPVIAHVADPASGAPRDVPIDGAALAGTLRLASYSTATTALVPYLLERAAHADYAPLTAMLLGFGSRLDEQLAYGMNFAITCSEDMPAVTTDDHARAAATFLGSAPFTELATICEGWPKGVVDTDLYAPFVAPVAALVLSGELDPVTPPDFGARAAAAFQDALHVVVPGQAHGQLNTGCAPRLIAAFLEAGRTAGLDPACLRSVAPMPFVLSPAGPAP